MRAICATITQVSVKTGRAKTRGTASKNDRRSAELRERRHPAQMHGKDQNRQRGDQKFRHRDDKERPDADHAVIKRAARNRRR